MKVTSGSLPLRSVHLCAAATKAPRTKASFDWETLRRSQKKAFPRIPKAWISAGDPKSGGSEDEPRNQVYSSNSNEFNKSDPTRRYKHFQAQLGRAPSLKLLLPWMLLQGWRHVFVSVCGRSWTVSNRVFFFCIHIKYL